MTSIGGGSGRLQEVRDGIVCTTMVQTIIERSGARLNTLCDIGLICEALLSLCMNMSIS